MKQIIEQVQLTYKNVYFVQSVGNIYVYYNESNVIPHFKLVKNSGEEFRIIIPQIKISDLSINDIVVLDNKEINRNDKYILLEWLKDKSIRAKKAANDDKINLIYLASIWNILNLDNDNVQNINMDIYQ